jgi:phosphopantothenoylcysteine decarboxylase/phosphopantothenate--cysteine ligase
VVEGADAYLVAPASANTIAKLAAGICDSMVTTAFLACGAPRAVAPAMNARMFEDTATQENLQRLRDRGVRVIDPESGSLASRGEFGIGRLPAPERLLDALEALVPGPAGPWDGLRVLITAGGTREPIDPVRYLGNRSSGRMGLALAAEARRRGAEVTLIAANVALAEAAGVRRVDVGTAAELGEAARAEFPACQVLIMAAAVSDFRPASASRAKIAREGSERLELELEATEDLLAELATERAPGQTVIGFAAEQGGDAVRRGREKLHRKGADAIVVNDVSTPGIGFEATENEVIVVTGDEEHEISRRPKDAVAEAILDRVDALRRRGAEHPAEHTG